MEVEILTEINRHLIVIQFFIIFGIIWNFLNSFRK